MFQNAKPTKFKPLKGNIYMTQNSSNNDSFSDTEIGVIEKCPLSNDNNEELADEPVDKIEIRCDHGSLDPLYSVSLVPSISSYITSPDKSYKDKLIITWIGPNIPNSIVVTCDNPLFKKKEISASGNTFAVDLFYYLEYSDRVTFVSLIKEVITYKQYDRYKISANPSTPILDISVTVYNPDTHIVELGFPPLKGMKGGKKRYTDGSKEVSYKTSDFFGSGKKKVTKEETSAKKIEKFNKTQKELLNGNKRSWSTWGKTTTKGDTSSTQYEYSNSDNYHSNTIYASSKDGSSGYSQTKESLNAKGDILSQSKIERKHTNKLKGLVGQSKIVLYRNSDPLQPDIINVVSNLFDIVKGISDVVITIKNWAPKYGFFFDWDVQLLTGSVAFGWGWNESSTNDAYYKLAASIDVTLIRVKLKIAFGLEIVKMGAQLFLSLMGAFGARYESDNNPDDNADELSVLVKGKIEGALGASVDAGFFLNATIKGVTGVELRDSYFVLNRSDVKLDGNVFFTGIKIKWTAGVLFGLWEDEDEATVVNPKKICDFSFPTETTAVRKNNWGSIQNKLASDIEDVLDGKGTKELKKLEVQRSTGNKGLFADNWKKVKNEMLAKRLASFAVDYAKENPINFDVSSTAIASEIRSSLDSFPKEQKKDFINYEYVTKFFNTDFPKQLGKFIDPVELELQNTNS